MKKVFFFFALTIFCTGLFCQNKIDKAALDTLLKAAEQTQTDGLVIYQDGKLYGEYYFGKHPMKIESMSSTKSIVNLAIGKMLTDSLIKSIDQPVYEFYPEWKQGMKKDITIRNLMNHTSGMQNFPSTNVEIYPSPDFVKLALAAEITDKPGTKFSYNNKAVNLLGGIVKIVTGKTIDNYLEEKIFTPLGIKDFDWTTDESGNPHCMSGFQVLPKDMAKLGQLFLQKGNWEGKQLIAENWFTETVTPGLEPACGLLWWLQYEKAIAIVDDAQINTLKEAGLDEGVLNKIRTIKGTYLLENYNPVFNEKVVNATPDWMTKYVPFFMSKGLTVSRKEYKNIIAYNTNGYLGNHMIIIPAKNLVVVRMISWDSFTKGQGKKDGTGVNNFEDFFKLAKKL
jgi:CubicO group peptidase (beta-lactamase class C family)